MDANNEEYHKAFLAIDVGGTNLKSAVFNTKAEMMDDSHYTIDTRSDGAREEILEAFEITVKRGLKYICNIGLIPGGIGIAFPGPFDYLKGIPLMKHKFLSIKGINLRKFLREIPGLTENIPINFVHDVNAVLAGELWKGNAHGYSNAAVVTLGTGLGFAFSKDKIIQCNSFGGPLVSVYNIPFKDGILEDYTGRKGFLRIYNKISGKNLDGIDVSDIAIRASTGDPDSVNTFHEVAKILSLALHDILIKHEIQCLLFGGQISRSFWLLEGPLNDQLKDIKNLQKVSVVKSIDNASFLGALKPFWDKISDRNRNH